MSAEANRTFLAEDAYEAWQHRVQVASDSVVVFGPYLDHLLDGLLLESSLEVAAIKVVTDLSPGSGALDYRAQLIGVATLLKRGIEVRSLPRLHAKVLVCDWTTVTIGSQNFTEYARRSHETTLAPDEDLSGSKFLLTLKKWFDAAVPVDVGLVEQLLTTLEQELRAVQDAQSAMVVSYERVCDEYRRELERQRQAEDERLRRQKEAQLASVGIRLTAAIKRTQERLARPAVGAERVRIFDKFRYAYRTLQVDDGSTFIRWKTKIHGKASADRSITPYFLYPVILTPSGQMSFGRVTKTRISYVRYSLDRGLMIVCGIKCRVHVDFPAEDFKSTNMHITLKPHGSPSSTTLKLLVQYDGVDSILVDNESAGAGLFSADVSDLGPVRLKPDHVARLFRDQTYLRQLVAASLSSFKYERLHRGDRNAETFFPPGRFQVTLLEDSGVPVFAVSGPH